MSVPPPGPNGTMIRTGLVGHAWANTAPASVMPAAAAARQSHILAFIFLSSSGYGQRCKPLPSSTPVDRLGLREEGMKDVVDQQVVDLLKARVGDARHHRELLVRVGQALEELGEII